MIIGMGCGTSGQQNIVHSLPAQRIEPRPAKLPRFKLPAEVLFGFEKVLKVEVRKHPDKRKLPEALVAAETTQQGKDTLDSQGEKDSAATHLAALRSNAGIVQTPEKTEKRVFIEGPQLDTLHTEEEFQPISPEPPEQISDEDLANWREEDETDHPVLV